MGLQITQVREEEAVVRQRLRASDSHLHQRDGGQTILYAPNIERRLVFGAIDIKLPLQTNANVQLLKINIHSNERHQEGSFAKAALQAYEDLVSERFINSGLTREAIDLDIPTAQSVYLMMYYPNRPFLNDPAAGSLFGSSGPVIREMSMRSPIRKETTGYLIGAMTLRKPQGLGAYLGTMFNEPTPIYDQLVEYFRTYGPPQIQKTNDQTLREMIQQSMICEVSRGVNISNSLKVLRGFMPPRDLVEIATTLTKKVVWDIKNQVTQVLTQDAIRILSQEAVELGLIGAIGIKQQKKGGVKSGPEALQSMFKSAARDYTGGIQSLGVRPDYLSPNDVTPIDLTIGIDRNTIDNEFTPSFRDRFSGKNVFGGSGALKFFAQWWTRGM